MENKTQPIDIPKPFLVRDSSSMNDDDLRIMIGRASEIFINLTSPQKLPQIKKEITPKLTLEEIVD